MKIRVAFVSFLVFVADAAFAQQPGTIMRATGRVMTVVQDSITKRLVHGTRA